MAINKRKKVACGDVVDASNYHSHKAGSRSELIDAALDGHVQAHGSSGRISWKPLGISILFIICAALFSASFLTYVQMLNVQEGINLLGLNLLADQYLTMWRDVLQYPAIRRYFSVSLLVAGAVFLGAPIFLIFLPISK